jgi:hypothetical protein
MGVEMSALEEKIVSALLKVMRSRRSSSAEEGAEPSFASPAQVSAARQREVQFSDFEAVAALKSRSGLSSDSLENWHRIWRDNAAVKFATTPLCKGWVLEADGRIVGYLGSVPLLYQLGERPLLAATASGFAVDPAYRALSLGLLASFYRQKNIDLFLNTTAIESVGKLAAGFQAQRLPQEDYDTVLFWVLDARGFVNAVAKKFGRTGALATVGTALGSLALKAKSVLHGGRHISASQRFKITEILVSQVGDDFELLWLRKLAEKNRLFANRDPAQLRWHFTVPQDRRETRVLRCESQGRLVGYAVVQSETEQKTGLRRCLLSDMLVEGDDPEAVKSLGAAAYDLARTFRSHVLEVLGFPTNLRRVFLQWKPYSRKFPACPFYFKARDHALQGILATADGWYASPFDGDTTLMP